MPTHEDVFAGALDGITVLDLASEVTSYGTRVLADLGAEVIRIEPPQGDCLRHRGPYYRNTPGPETSLRHLHFNTNKLSITLDITKPRGAELLRELARTGDAVLEAYAPGYLDSLALGYDRLCANNPGLVMVSVTPFGQTGPRSHYLGSDLIAAAMGGIMALNGFVEDPPVMPGAEQAYHMTSLAAAAAVMVAVYGRRNCPDGSGAHLDISMQDVMAISTLQYANANFYTWLGQVPKRSNVVDSGRGQIFACRDGYVNFIVTPHAWDSFVEWLHQCGLDEEVSGELWRDRGYRFEQPGPIGRAITRLCAQFTKEEVCQEGQRRRLLCMPINTVADLAEDPQLHAWDFFVEYDHPEFDEKLKDTGAPLHLSETPWQLRRPAPRLGEDNEAVYRQRVGLKAEEIASLRAEGVI